MASLHDDDHWEDGKPSALDTAEKEVNYRDCFSTPAGQAVLEDLIASIPRTCLTPGDPCSSHYQMGKAEALRNIALLAGMSETDIMTRNLKVLRHD